MNEVDIDRMVEDWFRRFEVAHAGLPEAARRRKVADFRRHIDEQRAKTGLDSEVEVYALLGAIGEPVELAAMALYEQPNDVLALLDAAEAADVERAPGVKQAADRVEVTDLLGNPHSEPATVPVEEPARALPSPGSSGPRWRALRPSRKLVMALVGLGAVLAVGTVVGVFVDDPGAKSPSVVIMPKAATAIVPNVVGQSLPQATSALHANGFLVRAEPDPHLPVSVGAVGAQHPAGGSAQPSGSVVSVSVAAAPGSVSTVITLPATGTTTATSTPPSSSSTTTSATAAGSTATSPTTTVSTSTSTSSSTAPPSTTSTTGPPSTTTTAVVGGGSTGTTPTSSTTTLPPSTTTTAPAGPTGPPVTGSPTSTVPHR